MQPSKEDFIELAKAKMPFGKYKDRFIIDLPEFYLIWYRQKGFPHGKLGKQLQFVLELKENGLEHLVRDFQRKFL